MADFESIVRSHANEDGSIPAEAIAKLTKAIKTAVGNEFVEKPRYKEKLEEIDALKAEKQTAEDSAVTAEKWKTKYEALKSDFAKFKDDLNAKETRAAKEEAYRELLTAAGIPEKRLATILRASRDNVDAVELIDGKIKDADKLTESIKNEWADFIPTTTVTGVQTATPPENNPTGKNPGEMTMAEYIKYRKGE